jgi:hypothetical protein
MMPPERKIVAESRAALEIRADQFQPGEEKRDHGSGEHFEEAFHPQVNHPPAPVLDNRKMGVLSPGEARAVEQADGPGGQYEEPQQLTLVAGIFQGGTNRPHHQGEPDQQSDEQQNLPRAPQIHVLIALVAPEKRVGIAQLVHDAEPLAGHGTGDDQQQGSEQHIHAEALKFRLISAHQGPMKRPAASHAVAIQKIPNCTCQVRVTL